MRRKLVLALAILATPGLAPAQTVDEVLASYTEARGGSENLAKIRTVVATGTAVMGGGMEVPFRYEWRRPDNFRFELTTQGITEVQAYDGETPWTLDPPNQPRPEPMSPIEFALINDAVDFIGPLVDARAKGHQVELEGQEELEGSQAFKLKVTKADGMVEYSYLDAEYFLEIAQVENHDMNGQPVALLTTWSDYKEFEGALLPGSWSRGPRGAPPQMTLLFEDMQVNVELPDERFSMPPVEE